MSCTQSDENTQVYTYYTDVLHDLINVQLGGYPLFLSNWPESLNKTSLPVIGTNNDGVLWHYISPEIMTQVHICMYIWHENRGHEKPAYEEPLGKPAYFAVTIKNPREDVTLRITSFKYEISSWTEDPLKSGICLAKSTLGGTLNVYPSRIPDVHPQTTNILYQKHTLEENHGIGIVYDFFVRPVTLGQAYSFECNYSGRV